MNDGSRKRVNEFLHNDFEPYGNKLEYSSKIERAWNSKTFRVDFEWD